MLKIGDKIECYSDSTYMVVAVPSPDSKPKSGLWILVHPIPKGYTPTSAWFDWDWINKLINEGKYKIKNEDEAIVMY